MNWKIPLFKTYSDKEDIKAVSRVIKRGTNWAIGPEVGKFEKKLADFVGTKYALVFNSGTSALHALLLAHGVKDKEVIVPSFTFIATANAVILAGGKPVFAEVETETYGLDAKDVEKRITSKTRAIITIQYGGCAGKDTKQLREIADKRKILFIEDSAQSLGSAIGNKKVGTFGHSAIFSFCQDKILSTGEGGALVTNIEEVCEKAKLTRSHGRVELLEDYFSSTKDFDYIQAGYNYRMSSMSAALGLSQLDKIKKIINLRRKHASYLDKYLSKIREIKTPCNPKGFYHIYQKYAIELADKTTRDGLQAYLIGRGIMTRVYFDPVHLKTLYIKNYGAKKGDLPETEALSGRILNLPIYPEMKPADLNYMIKTIGQFFQTKNKNEKHR